MCQEPARVAELIKQLRLDDHAKREEAAKSLSQLQSLPDSALNPVISFLGLEAVHALRWTGGPRQKVEVLPVVGDEFLLENFNAAPMRYIDRPFVTTGSLTRPTYGHPSFALSWQFFAANDAYNSFGVGLSGVDGRSRAGGVTVHMPRYMGSLLADQMENALRTQGDIKIRFRCIIQLANIDRSITEHPQLTSHQNRNPAAFALLFVEATDWQVLAPDGKTWLPWTYEDISLGFRLLSRVGKPSHPRAIDVVTQEVPLPDLRADALLREMAILNVLRLPAKDRAAAARMAQTRLRRARSPSVETWARRAYNSLVNGQLSAQ
jgi:hypothetical protein